MKVPSDPAQVSGNHLSFRVQLARPPHRARQFAGIAADTAQLPTVKGPAKRRAPVVWSGRAAPGEAAPTQLLEAMSAAVGGGGDAGATQVLPRVGVDADAPATVVGPRGPAEQTQLLRGMRPAAGAFDEQPYPNGEFDDEADWPDEDDGPADRGRAGGDSVRHAYYPGRRMDLGVVLLPLRIFLGLISVYAGMGKLCDPVYFDGGKRGSMVTWLTSLHPWAAAAPLREFALAHPVGSGLTVAFLQIIVGVLTIFGLWQRLAAAVGALLSIALLVTVSWRTHPVYDTPDIIYLAAWSPLVIAGAPFYSVDGRLAGEAWRRLGPRATLGELRRRVLRRGTVMATVLIGLTLLTGSVLGGAVRSAQPAVRPGSPSAPPVNNLPGSPLPQRPESGTTRRGTHGHAGPGSPRPSATGHKAPTSPSATPPAQGAVKSPTGPAGSSRPGATSGGPRPAPQTPHQRPAAPAAPHSPTGAATSGGTGGNGSSGGSGSSGGLSGGGALGGLLG
ncbi:membrane protein [Streptomyces caatingaensis]|uniref:Membrane protein n=1 Tax=Streptomyces caatingaensis TaxID=1678637 RepID=A0A0K9XEB3_9ACTN|nr:membrane protein [Streptomyces caatingaensis]